MAEHGVQVGDPLVVANDDGKQEVATEPAESPAALPMGEDLVPSTTSYRWTKTW